MWRPTNFWICLEHNWILFSAKADIFWKYPEENFETLFPFHLHPHFHKTVLASDLARNPHYDLILVLLHFIFSDFNFPLICVEAYAHEQCEERSWPEMSPIHILQGCCLTCLTTLALCIFSNMCFRDHIPAKLQPSHKLHPLWTIMVYCSSSFISVF